MTNQEKLNRTWIDSELRKSIENQRNVIGNLHQYLRNLRKNNEKSFKRVLELGLISKEEYEEAMKD